MLLWAESYHRNACCGRGTERWQLKRDNVIQVESCTGSTVVPKWCNEAFGRHRHPFGNQKRRDGQHFRRSLVPGDAFFHPVASPRPLRVRHLRQVVSGAMGQYGYRGAQRKGTRRNDQLGQSCPDSLASAKLPPAPCGRMPEARNVQIPKVVVSTHRTRSVLVRMAPPGIGMAPGKSIFLWRCFYFSSTPRARRTIGAQAFPHIRCMECLG